MKHPAIAFSLRYWLPLVFLTITSLACFADLLAIDPSRRITQYDIRLYQAKDGLPMNSVKRLFQDSKGFIWITTQEGFVRFDGTNFKTFNASNVPGLRSSFIWDIVEDSEGYLWLATDGGGVSRFDGRECTTFDTSAGLADLFVNVALAGQDNTLWFGTQYGLSYYQNNKFKSFPQLRDHNIVALLQDKAGNIYAGSHELGIVVLRNREIHRLDLRSKFFSFCESEPNVVLAGNTRGEIFQIQNLFVRPFSELIGSLIQHGWINAMLRDRHGVLWLATEGNGIARIIDGRVEKLDSPSELPTGDLFFSTVLEDSEGNIWFGGVNGVLKFTESKFINFGKPEGTRGNHAHGISQDLNGRLVATFRNSGVSILEPGRTQNVVKGEGLTSDNVGPVLCRANNEIWVSLLSSGMTVLKDEAISFLGANDFLCNRFVWALYEEGSNLWLGNEGCVSRFDGQKFEHYWLDRTGEGQPSGDAFGVRVITKTQDGTPWFGTWGRGLYRLEDNQPVRVDAAEGIDATGILALYEDADQNLWIGTDSHGLFRFKNGRFYNFTEKDGLFSDRIFSILEDDSLNLWFSCNKGIFKISKQHLLNFASGDMLRSTVYNHLDGMREAECNGRRQPAAWKGHDGRLWFTTMGGIAGIDPNNIPLNRIEPKVYLEELITTERSLTLDESPIDLEVGERQLEIRYTAPSFTVPERVRFKYRLAGFDREWIDAGTRRSAFYTNIPKGNYVFTVQACNNDGIWNKTGASFQLSVPPFWWETGWAYSIYVLLFLGILYGIRRFELNRHRLRHNLELQQMQARKLQELDKIKSRFFANISHEFRTPLTLILGPIRQMQDGTLKGNQMQQLGMMERNAYRLLQLINQLLDLSKLEAGKLTLSIQECDLIKFVERVVSAFESLATQQEISLDIHTRSRASDESALMVYFDRDKMEKIIVNLVANAFKFTPAGGTISIAVSKYDGSTDNEPQDYAELAVRDTGTGIPSDQLPLVFDRFCQAGNGYSKDSMGSGVGLALTKELVELHKGKIYVKSELGEGTEFTVLLPLGKSHFSEEEIASTKPDIEEEKWSQSLPEVVEPGKLEMPIRKSLNNNGSEKTVSVLVVEDNLDMLAYLRDQLDNDYRVVEAMDGSAGLKKALEEIPDIIISDVMMPGIDGFELCRRLKAEEKTSHIPVMLLTAKCAGESRIEGLELGADEYLAKPFDHKELSVRIKNLLEQRQRLQKKFREQVTVLKIEPDKIELPSRDWEFIQKAKNIVQENMEKSDFTVEQFARQMGFSKVHLNRKLKALTGENTGKFIAVLRLERAAQYLRQDVDNVTQIAYKVGFDNISYFARRFHEHFGVTPSIYKKHTPES